jgi:transcription elongation factor GreA
MKYLTPFGMAVLREKIAKLDHKREQALAGAGEAARNDSNSYHDNFEYEEGMRQQEMLSQQLRSLWKLLEGAAVAPAPADSQHVALGHYVVVQRQDSHEEEAYVICGDGEGALFENACSLSSPMGRALLGMAKGETKNVRLGDRSLSVQVIDIRVASAEDLQIASE